ncbi:hypothetical protein [Pseudonocardia zijingensis]|uniref:Uncharacterized protein n=1 Tax=Pseudonocardia zijingensis TaxID=153376 RepID=A0ABN1QJA5_9PSEU
MDEETASSDPPRSWRRQAAFWAGAGVLVAGIGVLGYAVGVADDVYPTRPADPPYTTFVEQHGPWVARGFAAVCGVLAVVPVGWGRAVSTRNPRPRYRNAAPACGRCPLDVPREVPRHLPLGAHVQVKPVGRVGFEPTT